MKEDGLQGKRRGQGILRQGDKGRPVAMGQDGMQQNDESNGSGRRRGT